METNNPTPNPFMNSAVNSDQLILEKVAYAISLSDEMALRNSLKSIHQKASNPFIIKLKDVNWKWMKYAAAFILTIALGTTLYFQFKSDSTSKLFTQYYSVPDATALRSAQNDDKMIVQQALNYYENKEYEKAIVLFGQVLEKNPMNHSARFYTGVSYMETEIYRKAADCFQFIILNEDNLYKDKSQWYLSLCYIKLNNVSEAAKVLKDLEKQGGEYGKKATQLLKKLQ